MLNKDDYRSSYRVERVGRLMATFSSRKYELLTANVVNLSTSGVRLFSQREFEDGEIQVDDLIHITITVTPEIVINSRAKVRYVKERVLGLEFRPRPEGDLLEAFRVGLPQAGGGAGRPRRAPGGGDGRAALPPAPRARRWWGGPMNWKPA